MCKGVAITFTGTQFAKDLQGPWWRHQMETFSALLAICAGNSPVPGEFPAQRPVTRSFDVFFDLRLNQRLSKQSWGWWFETLPRSLWRHYNDISPPPPPRACVGRNDLVLLGKVHRRQWFHEGLPEKETYRCMSDFMFAPSQWETALLCNDVSHWLGVSPVPVHWGLPIKSYVKSVMSRSNITPYCIILRTKNQR